LAGAPIAGLAEVKDLHSLANSPFHAGAHRIAGLEGGGMFARRERPAGPRAALRAEFEHPLLGGPLVHWVCTGQTGSGAGQT